MSPPTIFALSSGAPPAAISIVRISGSAADDALLRLAGRLPEPRRATLCRLRDAAGDLLDEALVLRLPGPDSVTGEDMVELHLHGGRATVAATLTTLAAMPGLAPAEPGAFTRRAFDNGRIGLSEVEGLADLLSAETDRQRRAALLLGGGALGRLIADWREAALAISAGIEATLDFADEDDVTDEPGTWRVPAAALADRIATRLAEAPAERLRDGVRIAIAGPPNAGKSTLLNSLAGRDAAIVTAIPGTTRDVIEVPVAIEGVPLLLLDTAGLRDADDAIERIGIARARTIIDAADILVWLGDDPPPPHPVTLWPYPRCDVRGRDPAGERISLSAVTGEGIGELIARLLDAARELLARDGEVALNRRHREALAIAAGEMKDLAIAYDPLLAAEHCRAALRHFDRIDGRSDVEAMLDGLFGRFCIGK